MPKGKGSSSGRKEIKASDIKMGIADPGFGRAVRGAAAVGRAAYKAGSVRAAGSRTLARDAAGGTAGGTARNISVGTRECGVHGCGWFYKVKGVKTGVGARKVQTNYPQPTGRVTNKKVDPAAVASKVPKKQTGVGARKK